MGLGWAADGKERPIDQFLSAELLLHTQHRHNQQHRTRYRREQQAVLRNEVQFLCKQFNPDRPAMVDRAAYRGRLEPIGFEERGGAGWFWPLCRSRRILHGTLAERR